MDDRETVARSVAVERLADCVAAVRHGAPAERVALDRIAGRTLAEPAVAPADVPERDFATMDGYAVAAGDDGPLSVVGRVGPADDPPALEPGEAVAIATGAPLPDRADAVLRSEDATVDGDRLAAPALDPETTVYPAGATAGAGEELFAAGDRLAPRHAALLRDVGVDAVRVARPLSVGVLATGTEIHEGRQPDRDSEMLGNLVRRWGGDPAFADPVPDDPDAVRDAVRRAAATHDLVLTTGGTSVGRGDHVGAALAAHDVRFRGVALRPGRPTTVAVVDGTPVCALPGKPVAALVAATLVVRPALTGADRLPTTSAECTARVTLPDRDVVYAVPVALADGRARPVGSDDAALPLYDERFRPGRVAASTRVTLADGLVPTRSPLDAGERVAVVPWEVVE